MRRIIISFVAAAFFLITFCTTSKESTSNLINDIWVLEFLKGVDYDPKSFSNQLPMIEIHLNDNNLVGNTGCNNILGTVIVDENEIEFSKIAATKMFCEEGIEYEFLLALGKVNNYKIEKMKLYLYEDDQQLMIFQKID